MFHAYIGKKKREREWSPRQISSEETNTDLYVQQLFHERGFPISLYCVDKQHIAHIYTGARAQPDFSEYASEGEKEFSSRFSWDTFEDILITYKHTLKGFKIYETAQRSNRNRYNSYDSTDRQERKESASEKNQWDVNQSYEAGSGRDWIS